MIRAFILDYTDENRTSPSFSLRLEACVSVKVSTAVFQQTFGASSEQILVLKM